MTKTAFTSEQFNNLISMGSSSDVENHVLALALVEHADFNENLVYILLLKKLGKINWETWKTHAPKTSLKLKNIIPEAKVITYKKIFDMLGSIKNNQEQILFFLDYFAKYLEKQCKQLGYDFIESLEIKIKTKNEPIYLL